jgi:hypothetical protein
VGEVERIRPTLGSTFGHDLGPKVTGLSDRRPRKQDHESPDHSKDDALDLHEQDAAEPQTAPIHISIESTDHLDLSA